MDQTIRASFVGVRPLTLHSGPARRPTWAECRRRESRIVWNQVFSSNLFVLYTTEKDRLFFITDDVRSAEPVMRKPEFQNDAGGHFGIAAAAWRKGRTAL